VIVITDEAHRSQYEFCPEYAQRVPQRDSLALQASAKSSEEEARGRGWRISRVYDFRPFDRRRAPVTPDEKIESREVQLPPNQDLDRDLEALGSRRAGREPGKRSWSASSAVSTTS